MEKINIFEFSQAYEGKKAFLTIDVKMEVLVHLACYVAGLTDVQAGIGHLKQSRHKNLAYTLCFVTPF